MDDRKRKFPYHSEVAGFKVHRPELGCNPGRESNDPRVFQELAYGCDNVGCQRQSQAHS